MNMTKMHTNYRIDPYDGLALQDVSGRTVTCVSGSVWLTMEGDTRDVVLEPGASFVVDRDGLTLLAAQRPSEVRVSAQNQPVGWRAWIADYLDKTYGPGAIRSDRKWVY
jgi:hypothetical protein